MTAMRRIRQAAAAACLLMIGFAAAARSDDAVDRLSVPGPLSFDAKTYRLSWSSHPTANYYKQEYLPAGETSEHYQSMLLLDAIAQGATVEAVVSALVDRLRLRKSTDPIVNFAIFKSPTNGEVIVDFVLSDYTYNKAGSLVEWNAYRYAALKDQGGHSGVLMFGLSRRAYGDDATEFLRRLKAVRPAETDALAKYTLPAVRPHE
ncbi:MAG: hypothetical protein JO213_16100 [Alphaproteobacteria bacterium]|nr:hypothetical protein [Alphaproteobacteria bacterium]MBV9586398.1 hypothetical protein [Alphaproteobacteria bacterium]MBV9964741.1 hypothetical protein [Alphaproteobacteria bacterium]